MQRQDPQQSVLVTGASTGIGEAIALTLAERGMRVFAGIRSEAAGERLRDQTDGALEPLLLDVTDEEQLQRAVAHVDEAVADAGLWGLVNNAGIVVAAPLEVLPADELRRQLEVNLVAPARVTQAFLPLVRRAGGRLLFTGSTSGLLSLPMMAPYCMSKFALEAMVDALRIELRPWKIEVSLLQPGAIKTPIWGKSVDAAKALMDRSPEDLQGGYRELFEAVLRLAATTAESASDPAIVAGCAVHALTANRPRARYLTGHEAKADWLVSLLPAGIRDRLLMRQLGVA